MQARCCTVRAGALAARRCMESDISVFVYCWRWTICASNARDAAETRGCNNNKESACVFCVVRLREEY